MNKKVAFILLEIIVLFTLVTIMAVISWDDVLGIVDPPPTGTASKRPTLTPTIDCADYLLLLTLGGDESLPGIMKITTPGPSRKDCFPTPEFVIICPTPCVPIGPAKNSEQTFSVIQIIRPSVTPTE